MSPSISSKPRSEAEIVKAILAYLKTVPGVVAWRQNVGAAQAGRRFVRFGFPGLSDIIGWIDGQGDMRREPVARFLAIEVKRPGGKLSPQQQAFGDLVIHAGGLFILATSVQDVVDALRR